MQVKFFIRFLQDSEALRSAANDLIDAISTIDPAFKWDPMLCDVKFCLFVGDALEEGRAVLCHLCNALGDLVTSLDRCLYSICRPEVLREYISRSVKIVKLLDEHFQRFESDLLSSSISEAVTMFRRQSLAHQSSAFKCHSLRGAPAALPSYAEPVSIGEGQLRSMMEVPLIHRMRLRCFHSNGKEVSCHLEFIDHTLFLLLDDESNFRSPFEFSGWLPR